MTVDTDSLRRGVSPIHWTPGMSIESVIKQVIENSMAFYRGNKTAASQSLGISIRTLDTKLEKYKKEKEDAKIIADEGKRKREDFLIRQRGRPPGAEFDSSATPSIHTPKKPGGSENSVQTETRVRAQPAFRVSAK